MSDVDAPFYAVWDDVLDKAAEDLDLGRANDRADFRIEVAKQTKTCLVSGLQYVAARLGVARPARTRYEVTRQIAQAYIDRTLAARPRRPLART